MKRRWIITVGLILFLGMNGLLVAMDEEDKVESTAYVKDWTTTITEDMSEEIHKQGVLTAEEKYPVYFDDSLGSFQEFSVEEGDMVNKGDTLFSYKVEEDENARIKLEAEADKVSDEIAAVEQAISTISAYDIEDSDGEEAVDSSDLWEDSAEDLPELEEDEVDQLDAMPASDAAYLKEQYIAEKEKELSEKQARLDSVQAQLTDLEMNDDTVTVESPYEGRVTDRSDGLKKPLMTIGSTQLHVKGELTERERMELEQGMPADAVISEGKKELTGTVENIKDAPKNVILKGANTYPFYVSFSEEADTESLLPGYHTDLSITTNESDEATVTSNQALFDDTVWVMTAQGKLEKQPVVTGIEQQKQTELKEGAESGERLATSDAYHYRSGEPFITPLKEAPLRSFFKQNNWKQAIAIGLLGR